MPNSEHVVPLQSYYRGEEEKRKGGEKLLNMYSTMSHISQN